MSPPSDFPRGLELLQDPRFNKGTAFTEAERDALGLRGLLPPRVFDQAGQLERVFGNLAAKPTDLEKYVFLIALQDRNETLFYRALVERVEELMPIVYTPTVGEASRKFGHIFRRPRGLYVTAEDRGRVEDVLANWPERDVRVIVVTDGERVLGLGDLGAHGMGIPIGKLALYTALAGIHPRQCLPIALDVGTDNRELREDPLYTGLLRERLRGERYDALLDEFVTAVRNVFPGALLQFEDFATRNAISLLARYRESARTFNDDIQGTAGVTLAGLLAAGRITGQSLADQRILFLGAGSAATGIADLIVTAMVEAGLEESDARRRCWFVDSKGLVVAEREDLAPHKRLFAHDHAGVTDLADAVDALVPTALVGVSGQGGAFSAHVLEQMARHRDRPIIFALSNPTANAECTAEEAYRHTDGRAVFASGSPFGPVEYGGRQFVPGQCNNVYVFPGLGLGVVATGAAHVSDAMFLAAARALSERVSDEQLRRGTVYPPLRAIRDLSLHIAVAVAEVAWEAGLATVDRPDDPERMIERLMYEPRYESYV